MFNKTHQLLYYHKKNYSNLKTRKYKHKQSSGNYHGETYTTNFLKLYQNLILINCRLKSKIRSKLL